MKQLFKIFVAAALLIASSCVKEYDDSALSGRIDDLDSRVRRLELLCQQMNTNISSLQAIVTALQNNDCITGVSPVVEKGRTVGYTITFAKAQSITIYHGKDGQNGADGKDGQDGKDGADGEDGHTPIIGVRQDTDGIYYWTLDGEWLLDGNGNKIKAQGADGKDGADGTDGTNGKDGADGKDGITPQLKIENGYWYISYDNGATWTQLGKATGDDGNDGSNGTDGTNGADGKSFFQDVTQDDNNVYFTLADGTVITVPKGSALSIAFDEADMVVMSPDSMREIGYTVTSASGTVKVEVTSSADIKARVVAADESGLTGRIHIKTGASIDEYSKVIVFVSDDYKVIMRSIVFEEAGLQVEDNAVKNAPAEGGELTLEFLSNVECEAVVPQEAQSWISVAPGTRAMERHYVTLKLEPNEGGARSADVLVRSVDGKLSVEYTINQYADTDYQLALEREALIAIYNALDGDNWTDKENWCSDKPVGEWYGVTTDNDGFVVEIRLNDNNLKGGIPIEIGYFSNLVGLELTFCQISGTVPEELGNLKSLHSLNLSYTNISGTFFDGIEGLCNLNSLQLVGCPNLSSISENIKFLHNLESFRVSGLVGKRVECSLPGNIGECKALQEIEFIWANTNTEIPGSIGNLSNLKRLCLNNANFTGPIPIELANCRDLQVLDLQSNNLNGGLPSEIGDLHNLRQIILMKNHLTGDIPESLLNNRILWSRCWAMVMYDNSFNSCRIPAPQFTIEDYYGNTINSTDLYKSNQYTALIQTNLDFYTDLVDINKLKELYSKYKDCELNILDCVSYHLYAGEEYNMASDYINNYDIPWNVTVLTDSNNLFSPEYHLSGWGSWYPLNDTPGIVLVSKEGEVVMYSSQYYGDMSYAKLDNYLSEQLLGVEITPVYESTDYSKDGEFRILQEATKGNGIDIVLMGDGYTDRLIDEGEYDNAMGMAMENFFTVEPYKTYRDYFNVYSVYVVSPNEGYDTGKETTALNCTFKGGTLIEGNAEKVFKYTLNAVKEEKMDNVNIIVVMNSDKYAGTCYYFNGDYCDYGSGVSIAYIPFQDGDKLFEETVHHEACGHGFAKLADEYAYEYMGAAPGDYVSEILSQQDGWGWWKNVDFTGDVNAVRWSRFIDDSRYANEGLGAYEGGLTYWTGVWRPTDYSIMRYNTGGFNAPSREAIYYRIHKLAYGDSWNYDYEEFVEWDARNRAASGVKRVPGFKPANYRPTHPPVVVKKSWKE